MIIPTRNSQSLIGRTIAAALAQGGQGVDVELVVADDGSLDNTAALARAAGARVVLIAPEDTKGNPGAARNRGAASSTGDPLIFLDADCTPEPGWLNALLAAHDAGEVCVGGSLALPARRAASARLDYYCTTYHMHPRRPPGPVPNHSPANLSVRRADFLSTSGFSERLPTAHGHEELAWQVELQRQGKRIYFEPKATVTHANRKGIPNLLRRSYRWAYSSIESKSGTGAARSAWLYRFPALLILAAVPLSIVQTVYIVGCWLRAGVYEPLLMLPGILVARLVYAAGMTVGGLRWLRRRRSGASGTYPRWI